MTLICEVISILWCVSAYKSVCMSVWVRAGVWKLMEVVLFCHCLRDGGETNSR